MPLQIRRGTDAERIAMTQKLTPGELLWVTDAKKLYVGDGTTASSILPPVTGFNAEDAQSFASSLTVSLRSLHRHWKPACRSYNREGVWS